MADTTTQEVEVAAVTFSDKAKAVVAEMAKKPGLSRLAADTPWLDFVKDLLAQLLPTLIGCVGSAEAAAKELKNPGLLVRLRTRMFVRRAIGDAEAADYLLDPLVSAIYTVAKATPVSELKALAA